MYEESIEEHIDVTKDEQFFEVGRQSHSTNPHVQFAAALAKFVYVFICTVSKVTV